MTGGRGSVLEVEQVSKSFARSFQRARRHGMVDMLSELGPRRIGDGGVLRRDEFWAVEDLSLSLAAGDAIAIVGANGAGKSTALRIIDGLTKPTVGLVRVVGRPAALISLGSAFDPVLTGREAIRAEAAALRLAPRLAHDLMDRVIEFAELGDFIDAPIVSYSTGMRMRLGYAIAVQAEPDVLLIDEVLAVGDVAFQHKCVRHIRRFIDAGGSLVLVSHDMWMVQNICDSVVVLDDGRAVYQGAVTEGIEMFLDMQAKQETAHAAEPVLVRPPGPVEVVSLRVEAAEGRDPRSGAPARVVLEVTSDQRFEVRWGFSFAAAAQLVCLTSETSREAVTIEAGRSILVADLPQLPLVGGSYLCRAAVLDAHDERALGSIGWDDPPLSFVVVDDALRGTNARRLGKALLYVSATSVG